MITLTKHKSIGVADHNIDADLFNLGCLVLRVCKCRVNIIRILQHQVARNSYVVPGHVAWLVACLTQKPEVPGSIPFMATYFLSPSADSRRAKVCARSTG